MPISNGANIRKYDIDHLFQLMGHFQLDDNTGSGFESRELKTVYLDVIC